MTARRSCPVGKTTKCRAAAFAAGLSLLGVLVTATAADEYVWGTSSAWLTADEGFEGYWKYCVTVTWNVHDTGDPAHALSHVSILLGLETCGEACKQGYFAFDDTIGMSIGCDSCPVYYYGEFDCKGDPTIPDPVPTVKFEPYSNYCEPGIAGTAYVCFYSLAPPRPARSFPSSVWIKFGRDIASGILDGVLPSCSFNSVEPSTWGRIKALIE